MTKPTASATHHVQRHDIEGLRALAVVLVVAGHLGGQPAGGFIGVDVFFVISGFLITGLLVREVERSGRISFREFYARRVRRILPVALLVLAVTCLAARLLFFESRANQTYADSVWAAFSLENWHLAAVGTDYFASTLPPSPVQQYWSLSVEEQFYLAWPVLIVLTAALARRLGARSLRAVLTGVLGVVVVASFVWAFYQSGTETTVAYFSTLTRAWELGVGGLLALLVSRLGTMTRWASAVLGWGGIAGIVVAAVITRADSTFPAPGALPAVLGTAALIAGGSAARPASMPLLTNPVSRFLGRISYSVYLWHWPVIIVAESLWGDLGWQTTALVVAVTVGLSVMSYRLVEEPIRRTTWLSKPVSDRPARALDRRTRTIYSGTLVATALLAVVFALQPQTPGTAGPATAGRTATPGADNTGPAKDTERAAWKAKVDAAVVTPEWPDLQPSLDVLVNSRASMWTACGNVNADYVMVKCQFGDKTKKPKTMVVLGDSVAISWLPAMRSGFESKGWFIQGLTFGECPPARIDVESASKKKQFTIDCAAHQKFALDQAVRLKPDLIVLSDTGATAERVVGAGSFAAGLEKLSVAQADALAKLSGSGAKLVVLSAPPSRPDLVSCATRVGTPADCLASITPTWTAVHDMEESVATKAGATYIDASQLTCDELSYCPSFIGTTPVMADGIHLTDAMSQQLGPLLYQEMTKE